MYISNAQLNTVAKTDTISKNLETQYTIDEEIGGLLYLKECIDKIIEETEKQRDNDDPYKMFTYKDERSKELHDRFDYDIQEYMDRMTGRY